MLTLAVGVLSVWVAAACGGDDPGTDADDGDGGADNAAEVGEALGSQSKPSTTTTTSPPVAGALAITSVAVPAEAPAGNDACQPPGPTTFGAANLTDGLVDTAWRMPGDATGQELTITLAGPYHVTNVGLVPGYAKIDPCDSSDRFFENRRVSRVTWTFDDGTSVSQDLRDAAEMQTVAAEATTTSIRLRIEGVTDFGRRDFTALSEVAVRGY